MLVRVTVEFLIHSDLLSIAYNHIVKSCELSLSSFVNATAVYMERISER